MVDTPVINTSAPEPVAVVSTPVAAPIPVAVEAPVVATQPVVEAQAAVSVEVPVAVPEAQATTVLGEAIDKAPVPEAPKPAETPLAEAPKQEGDQSAEPAPPPTFEPFTLPEGIQPDVEGISKLTEILSELETTSKTDHALVQQFGQKAVDLHISEVQKAVDNVQTLYQTAWEKQKTDWKDAFLKDPDIGGNRFQTTVDAALTFISTHGGNTEQQAEFRNLMETSGLGNHPAMIRLLANAGRAMSEGRPLAASTPPAPAPKSKTQTLYGKAS